MKASILLNLILVVAGMIGVVVGGGMLFTPIAFHASSGIVLEGGTNLLNEMRASGGALLAGGLFIFAGAFLKQLRLSSIMVAMLFYLSYGASRLFSVVIDGMPDKALLMIATSELVIGLICAAAFLVYREPAS